jgi:very-short-patch-repair endonuclease
MTIAEVSDADGPLLELQYGPAATIWRMNYGWRRRKKKSDLGFMINPVTGHWVGGVDGAGEENGEDAPPDKTPPQPIVPFVEDRRNILVVRPSHKLGVLSTSSMTTLQFALKRGMEAIYQLEESELVGEPLPNRDNRQSILFFEAAEGGAGVLTRLATEPHALAAVAAQALEIMHYQHPVVGHVWSKKALAEVLDEHGKPICEAGCYRCLLSYYNQPDHPNIDRKDVHAKGLVLDILCRLTSSKLILGTQGRVPIQHDAELTRMSTSSLEKAWLAHVEAHGHRKPDRAQHTVASAQACADFFYDDLQLVVFIDGPHHDKSVQQDKDEAIDRKLDEQGFLVVRFPKEQTLWSTIFAKNSDLFGASTKE